MKTLNKFLIIGALVLGVFTVNAHAQTAAFSRDLAVGSSGSDVSDLQTWLIANGYDIPALTTGGGSKGYFGAQTKLALIQYQTRVRLPATGFFGPLTRGGINGSDLNRNKLTVLTPNGGETLNRSVSQAITWAAPATIRNQTADIRLEYALPACAEPTQPIRCMIAVRAPIVIAKNIGLYPNSYLWSIDSSIADGKYKIQICSTDGTQCDVSNNYFNITTSQAQTGAPSINGLDAPIALTIGQNGTWTVRATDPQNSTLNYSVDWGDVSYYVPQTGDANPAIPYTQNSTFTHVYSTAGVFAVRFMVKNAAGLIAETTATVVVKDATTASSLKISSPNGGESWLKGTTQNITWTSPYYSKATGADIGITRTYACKTNPCATIDGEPYTIATNIPINQNSFSWKVGNVQPFSDVYYSDVSETYTIPDGQYSIKVCETHTSNCDTSDMSFTVSSTVSTGVPDINIVSPNGGETWMPGTSHVVTVNVSGDQSKVGNTVGLILMDWNSTNIAAGYSLGSFSTGSTPGPKSYTVTIPATQKIGDYKIYATLSNTLSLNSQSLQAYDFTDAAFRITSTICPVGYSCIPEYGGLGLPAVR